MKNRYFGFTLCSAIAVALIFTGHPSTSLAAAVETPMEAHDVDGNARILPPKGRLTIVMYTNADLEQESKALSKLLDPYRGAKDFLFVQIVDLRGEIPAIARRMAEKQIRDELDIEATRVKPFYVKNGSSANPRTNLSTIVDYGGSALSRFDWNERVEKVRFAIYSADGRLLQRIDDTQNLPAVSEKFRSLLGK
jgi:hypothetical protein